MDFQDDANDFINATSLDPMELIWNIKEINCVLNKNVKF